MGVPNRKSRRSVQRMLLSSTAVLFFTVVNAKTFDSSLNSTWRCGVFVPIPDEKYQEPLAKYFILQNQLPANCPANFKDNYKFGTFPKHCAKMGLSWEKLWSPSDNRETRGVYGDEVCDILTNELEMPDVPNEVFPEGVQFGFFYNYCENAEWKDTGKRTKKAVCCQGGKYKSCDEVFAELEEGAADDSSSGDAKNGKSGKGNGGKDRNSQNGGDVSFPGNEEAARLQNIEEKLKRGKKLSKSEIQ